MDGPLCFGRFFPWLRFGQHLVEGILEVLAIPLEDISHLAFRIPREANGIGGFGSAVDRFPADGIPDEDSVLDRIRP